MKKKIFGCLAVLVVAVIAAWNVNFSFKTDSTLSDVALANIEALADPEEPGESGGSWHESKSTKYSKTDEVINGVNMKCDITEVTCSGNGQIWCKASYTKICSES